MQDVKNIYIAVDGCPSKSMILDISIQIIQLNISSINIFIIVSNSDYHYWLQYLKTSPLKINVVIIDIGPRRVNCWLRDGGIKVNDSNSLKTKKLIVTPWSRDATQQSLWKHIAKLENLQIEIAPFPIEGGNIISNGKYIFVGVDTYEVSEKLGYLSREKIQKWIQNIFPGKDIIGLGGENSPVFENSITSGFYSNERLGYRVGSKQPFFHLDMYLFPVTSVGNRNKIILSSVINYGNHNVCNLQSKQIEHQAEELTKLGFDVIWMPMPTVISNVQERLATYYCSYVNVIELVLNNQNVVFVPQYGRDDQRLIMHDQEAVQVWKKLGYSVKKIDCSGGLAHQLGGLRCLTLEIQ